MTEKAAETMVNDTLGVGSGSGVIGSINPSELPAPQVVKPLNDQRRHPDPTLAATIATMSLAGFTIPQVCAALRISANTLSEHYDHEMKQGRTNMMTQVVGSLAQRAIAGSDAAAIFLAKARLGWSDRQQVELTGANGGPIEIAQRTEVVSKLAGRLAHGITIDGEAHEVE
jgi:hypothetical protein